MSIPFVGGWIKFRGDLIGVFIEVFVSTSLWMYNELTPLR